MITLTKRARIQNYEKMIKEGRGYGIGREYIPWLKIQDVPSLGRATRLKGIKTGRQHEFLSDMERNYFYILEYSDNVIDIREQFPLLPLEETILIANELGINHPKHPETGEFIVMTTDFLLTVDGEDKMLERARTIKAKDDLLDKRVIEKFEIERVYWSKKGIDWGIVTEEEIDKAIAHNISYVHGYKDISNLDCFIDIATNEIKDLIYEFLKRIVDDERPMRVICSEFDNEMLLGKGSGLSIFKYLVINKVIEIDIKKRINVNQNIPIINVREEEARKVEVI
ncbi:TnsA endonuclease N-terminal domain-containing protein [Clostridium tertium]|uniref:TnsA endonuclease N-terminal domain-containing protein n=1 Tax=Clostridium tertium TaxID=1559 RepID=UPI001C1DF9D1|nr:TnsA endonuclease N-terminal domain-containing protein [Clostridium tertium]MBU6134012.1 TnsA endonuclease N-terminal domain-containing protein [Clostridium tertium]